MKFNALVVAAMVITSVNAGWYEGFPGCLGRICGPGSESSQNSRVNGQEPAMPQDTPGDRQEPGPSQDPPVHNSGKVHVSKPTKTNPKCGPLLLELAVAWTNIDAFNCRSESQDKRFFKLITGQNTGEISDGLGVNNDKKGDEVALRTAAIQKYIKENPRDIPGLREIQAESISLERVYCKIWKRLQKAASA
ncbi:hypothetical protein BASA60_009410 [Batrachochytrium salamandrivorans]|nr:hypothetical protein BASA60_009410 [Batrachochytrium salamandrivorans]